MNTRTISIIFGVIFVLVGIIGFVPNPLVHHGGVFAVNLAHNLVHIITGAAFLAAGFMFADKSDVWVKVIGVLYAVVAIAGFLPFMYFSQDMLLGLIHINPADRWLHAGLAVAILAAGFLLPPSRQPVAA
jgi:hypothetical protein